MGWKCIDGAGWSDCGTLEAGVDDCDDKSTEEGQEEENTEDYIVYKDFTVCQNDANVDRG